MSRPPFCDWPPAGATPEEIDAYMTRLEAQVAKIAKASRRRERSFRLLLLFMVLAMAWAYRAGAMATAWLDR